MKLSNLSVIIPTYNSQLSIERCLDSLAAQNYQDFEVYLIDGGSSDRTLAIASDYRSHLPWLRIISEPDKGTYDAMNKGIDAVQGRWIYFMGSDDEIYDENVFFDIFNSSSIDKYEFIYGDVLVSGDTNWAKSGQLYDGYFDLEKILTKNICHQSIFYRKSLFERWGRYSTKYPICADWDINIRFFSRTNPLYVDRTIANFYSGGLSSKACSDPMLSEISSIRESAMRAYNQHKFFSLFQKKEPI
jgi:glycosyltransferase involved in cell wall biosynthesis